MRSISGQKSILLKHPVINSVKSLATSSSSTIRPSSSVCVETLAVVATLAGGGTTSDEADDCERSVRVSPTSGSTALSLSQGGGVELRCD